MLLNTLSSSRARPGEQEGHQPVHGADRQGPGLVRGARPEWAASTIAIMEHCLLAGWLSQMDRSRNTGFIQVSY